MALKTLSGFSIPIYDNNSPDFLTIKLPKIMKTNFLKISFMALLVSAFSLFTLASCDKDDDLTPGELTREKIVGTWEIYSFRVDTSEYIGVLVDSSTVKFESFTGTEGNFQQKVIYSDGEQESISGKYRVDNIKQEVTMTASGEANVVKVSFSSNFDKMEWEGEDEELDVAVKVKAQRK